VWWGCEKEARAVYHLFLLDLSNDGGQPPAVIRFWNNLRLRWFLATRALEFSSSLTDRLYRIYLNHSKVIHFRDGHPVFSLTTPALYSKPAANMMARSLYRGIQNKNIPNLMSFAVTDVCNAHCVHCSFYEAIDDKSRHVMSLDECRKLIHAAQELGVSMINFVGGEPLKRPEILEMIRSVDKDLSATSLFTNGWALSQMAAGLRQSGLDGVYVSLDSTEAAKHDEFRGLPGLFSRAVDGVRAALRTGMSVGISTCITPEGFAGGDFERMVEFARELGVHELIVFDAMPSGRFRNRADLFDNEQWKDEMIRRSEPYNADASYPGILIHAYTVSHRSAGCSCGTSYFYANPYGDISSCDFNARSFGNVLDEPLHAIWERMTSQEAYREAKWGGCKVKDSVFTKKHLERETCVSP
jgi:MoaA/NifB/PqqE/SkfB family radical SAM enzyme